MKSLSIYFLAALTLLGCRVIAPSVRPQNGANEIQEDAAEDRSADPDARQDLTLDALINRIEVLEERLMQSETMPTEENGLPESEESRNQKAPTLSDAERREQEQLVRTAFERELIDRGGLLLPPFTFEFEPNIAYLHSSSDRIAIDGFSLLPVLVVGEIVSERVRRNQFSFAAAFRAGLPWDMQLDLRIPYRYEKQRLFTADVEEVRDSINGLGDVELSLSHHFFKGRGRYPDLLTGFRWKSKTGKDPFRAGGEETLSLGTGFYGFEWSFTGVKVSDPVVFFGGLRFTYNDKSAKPVGKIDPGNGYGLHMGMALALNLDVSMNFAYEQQYTDQTKLNGVGVPGSRFNTGTLSIGTSVVLSPKTSFSTSIGIGLTQDASDLQLNFSLPIRFSI